MSTVAFSPEDLLQMPDGERYELVDGQLVERDLGAESSFIAGETYGILRDYSKSHRSGWAFPEGTSYQCFPTMPEKVRRADASFIRAGRLPGEWPPKGHIKIAPDLAVEVVSPGDLAYEVDEKVEEYIGAGVALVWVVNPVYRTVRVYRGDGSGVILRADDELTGGDVLPGFRCKVSDLFAAPLTQSHSTIAGRDGEEKELGANPADRS
jgi:Uma2 family endonuclease